jgi:coenzyme F420-reducing hydrogenase alpha subunit
MLHAPDFLGYEDAIQMAKDFPDLVNNALKLKKIGNDIMVLLGGREIHPINLKVGGFYKVPTSHELKALVPNLEWGCDTSIHLAHEVSKFPFPEFSADYEYICLKHPQEYAIIEGSLFSNKGCECSISQYDLHLEEHQVPHSTALHSKVVGRDTAHVGPMARYSANFSQLSKTAKETAQNIGLATSCTNPFKSILIRLIEVIHSFESALEIVRAYTEPDAPSVDVTPRGGTGHGCTEAPRGICYHQYTIDEAGIIQKAKIVSPTAVNQATIEKDLIQFVGRNLELSDQALQHACEQMIRNYDPCISCSAHFLKFNIDRSPLPSEVLQ